MHNTKTSDTHDEILFRALRTYASILEEKLDLATEQGGLFRAYLLQLYCYLHPNSGTPPTHPSKIFQSIMDELSRRGISIGTTNGGGAQ